MASTAAGSATLTVMETAGEGERRGEAGEQMGEKGNRGGELGNGVATTGRFLRAWRRPGGFSGHGAHRHRHGKITISVVAAVAGRWFISVEAFSDPVDVRLAKKIERVTGRGGLPAPTYRFTFEAKFTK
jgi:hypothetical protein